MANRSAGIPGSALLLGATGVYLIYVGVKDIPIVDGLRLAIRGSNPAGASRTQEQDFAELGQNIGAGVIGFVQNAISGGSTNPADMRQVPGTSIRVHSSIVQNVTSLVVAARSAGHNLNGGGFRDSEQQRQLREQNCPDPVNSPASACSPPTAPVGRSMHERGLAIDFTIAGRTLRSSDAAFRWLKDNAARYGLKNLPSEPWHWSTNGS